MGPFLFSAAPFLLLLRRTCDAQQPVDYGRVTRHVRQCLVCVPPLADCDQTTWGNEYGRVKA